MNLKEKLNRIQKIFPPEILDKFLNEEISNEKIKSYYKTNKLAYSLLHSKTNLIHMAISREGKYKEEDLLEPAKIIAQYIEKINAKEILEIACGRGANTNYLAKKFPQHKFTGIDISNDQIAFTKDLT